MRQHLHHHHHRGDAAGPGRARRGEGRGRRGPGLGPIGRGPGRRLWQLRLEQLSLDELDALQRDLEEATAEVAEQIRRRSAVTDVA